ncbi:MAG: serine/threonine protein kinase [Thermoguttaceae bacterium]|nr:serine/threonine protein kinase [Thermoguttaceae bacterium]
MAKLSTDAFLDYLKRSQLTEDSRLAAAIKTIRENDHQDQFQDADYVASELVKQGLITNWHVRQLMKKKHKGFYLRQYRILGHLGSGGMSTVYLAEHILMHRRVAIKVLPKKRLANSNYLDRFVREAQAIASLDHPHIVRAYDFDRLDDIHYIVMEYFEGENLRQLVEREGPLPFEDAVNYLRQAAEGLEHAHRLGIIHRDVKPENLLVNDKGNVKVLDLGLALLDETAFNHQLSSINEDKILGTADYLAPEQAIDSHNVDARADIYGLGGTLYFCLTGHSPFPNGTVSQRLLAHQREPVPSIFKDRPDAPQDLVDICEKMLAKKPADRFQSAHQLVLILERWLVHHGFAESSDFNELTHADREFLDANQPSDEIFLSDKLRSAEDSENATELGNRENSFLPDNRDFLYSSYVGLGQEDFVDLFDTGTGSMVKSGSHSKGTGKSTTRKSVGGKSTGIRHTENAAENREIVLSKNALKIENREKIDPFLLALSEIERNRPNVPQQNISSVDTATVSANAELNANIELNANAENAAGSSPQDSRKFHSTPSTARLQKQSAQKRTGTAPRVQSGTQKTGPKKKSDSGNIPVIEKKEEVPQYQTEDKKKPSAVSTSKKITKSLLSQIDFGDWYKEIPIWFWAAFIAGYVLAIFLAGILFALLMTMS